MITRAHLLDSFASRTECLYSDEHLEIFLESQKWRKVHFEDMYTHKMKKKNHRHFSQLQSHQQ